MIHKATILLSGAGFFGALAALTLAANNRTPDGAPEFVEERVELFQAPDELGLGDMRTYEVTVFNATRHQPLSPVLVMAHNTSAAIFRIGQSASAGLRELAEEGDNSLLMANMIANPNVGDVVSGTAPIGPGSSETMTITLDSSTRLMSLATMLVNTNDAFAAVNGLSLPNGGTRSFAIAYDAGTEANNESCAFVPGPACGAKGAPDEAGAEGFVHVHPGIHGVADLDAAEYDWRNPAIYVTVRRIG